jgi:hypothetical protein
MSIVYVFLATLWMLHTPFMPLCISPTPGKLLKHHLKSKCGNDVWTLNKKEVQKFKVVQMCVLRPLLGFTRLEHQTNSGIKEAL